MSVERKVECFKEKNENIFSKAGKLSCADCSRKAKKKGTIERWRKRATECGIGGATGAVT